VGRVHEDMARDLLEDFMRTAKGAQHFQWHAARIRNGTLADDGGLYRDSIHQGYRNDDFSLEQIAAFIHVHAAIMDGDVAVATIETGGAIPAADSERTSNAERLAGLPAPLSATVDLDQHCADSDGLLWWTRPIRMSISTGIPYIQPCGGKAPLDMRRYIEPRHVPLEIGTTKASVTLFHLMRDRGVARWPYGHDRIVVFAVTEASGRWRFGI
jgi:hypothetical protein